MFDYDRSKTAAGPVAEKFHKGATELQHAITTIDQVEFQTEGLPQNLKAEIKACVKELEAAAQKMEKVEKSLHVWETSKK